MPLQDEYQTSLPEITISPKKKRIVNAAGNPQLQQASQNYIDKAVLEEIERGATAMREGLNDATKVAAPIVAAATLPAVASTGTIGTVVNGIKALAPGSTFWMNPVTKQMFTSTLGGNVWNGAYKGLTRNNWDDAVANQTEQLTGWNPLNSPWTSWMPGMTNPGYILPYNVVSNVTNGMINSIESRIPVKPKFTKDVGLNIPIEKLVTIEGLNFSKVHPNFPRGSNKRQVEELINSIIDKHSKREFTIEESLGKDFSSDSAPLLFKSVARLSNRRLQLGRFPGTIRIISNNRVPGNLLGNVNIGTKENPRIAKVYGKEPSVEEIANYMTRQQALDRINQKLAFVYQTLLKNSENLPFMPKFTFSQSPADVIKTRGATASPNATLKIGTDIVPMWATFPENPMTPNYPDISFIMKSGGKLVKRKKR